MTETATAPVLSKPQPIRLMRWLPLALMAWGAAYAVLERAAVWFIRLIGFGRAKPRRITARKATMSCCARL